MPPYEMNQAEWKSEPQRDDLSPAKSPEQTAAPNPELRFEMSNGIGKLIEALAKARKVFKPVKKDFTNPFYKSKYADLAAVIDATKDGLSENGLAIVQPPAFERSTGTVEILTLLAHASGEWVKSILHMPVNKTDAQGVGSAITYGRRYAYSAVLNVASEDDDDANTAVADSIKKHEKAFEEREAKQPVEKEVILPKQAEGSVVLNKISKAKTKAGLEYWNLDVIDVNGNSSLVSVFDHKLMLPELWNAGGKDLFIKVESKEKAGKVYYNLKSIQQIGSQVITWPLGDQEEIPMFDGE